MKYNQNEIDALPDVFSLDSLRTVCHISKRTARYYLQSGLIPCTNNGKKTHCYSIRKEDLITALQSYKTSPCLFAIPDELYYGAKYRKGNLQMATFLPEDDVASPTAKEYYRNRMTDLPDLLTVAQVSALTGYTNDAVNRWCNEGKLKCHHSHPHRWIPKKYLLDYLLSDTYNNIVRKSDLHLHDLRAIFKEIHKGG